MIVMVVRNTAWVRLVVAVVTLVLLVLVRSSAARTAAKPASTTVDAKDQRRQQSGVISRQFPVIPNPAIDFYELHTDPEDFPSLNALDSFLATGVMAALSVLLYFGYLPINLSDESVHQRLDQYKHQWIQLVSGPLSDHLGHLSHARAHTDSRHKRKRRLQMSSTKKLRRRQGSGCRLGLRWCSRHNPLFRPHLPQLRFKSTGF